MFALGIKLLFTGCILALLTAPLAGLVTLRWGSKVSDRAVLAAIYPSLLLGIVGGLMCVWGW